VVNKVAYYDMTTIMTVNILKYRPLILPDIFVSNKLECLAKPDTLV